MTIKIVVLLNFILFFNACICKFFICEVIKKYKIEIRLIYSAEEIERLGKSAANLFNSARSFLLNPMEKG